MTDTDNPLVQIRDLINDILDADIIYTGGIEESMRFCGIDRVQRLLERGEQAITTLDKLMAEGESVDHRKIGCLIHDNIDLSKQKHEITLAIYDAIKSYIIKDAQPPKASDE